MEWSDVSLIIACCALLVSMVNVVCVIIINREPRIKPPSGHGWTGPGMWAPMHGSRDALTAGMAGALAGSFLSETMSSGMGALVGGFMPLESPRKN